MRIFISHSGRDKALIREILSYLPPHVRRWLDEEQLLIGMELGKSIETAISDDADYVVIFLSRDAIASNWVQKEFEWALRRERNLRRQFVLPVLLEDVWEQVQPEEFRKRKYLRCFDQSKRSVENFAEQLKDELFAWLSNHFDEATKRFIDKRLSASVAGSWKSTFTWDSLHDRDPGESSDLVEITQDGDEISGNSVDGEYEYRFRGRLRGEYVLGEWEGRKLPLFGVFQLKIDIDTGDFARGYWIGNGARKLYQGEWSWEREKTR